MDRYNNLEESPNRKIRIFISYSREDYQEARRLYKDFMNAGLDPWLDDESLVPGQNWESAIREALKKSRYFIPLFSSISISKRGFTLKEFRFALEVLDTISPSDIFIIPVRLDSCEIPYEKLKIYQYVDLFPSWNDGLQKILEATGIVKRESKPESSLTLLTLPDYSWDKILTSMYEKKCIPFIGAEAHTPWIPLDRQIARTWAQEYGYPLEGDELSKVALYLAIKNDDRFPKMLLSRYISDKRPPNVALEEYRNTLYGVFARLDLPIYITTNYDHFMEEALKTVGREPVSEFCRWNEKLVDYTKTAGIRSVFDKGRMYLPTAAQPLVYHLFGDLEVPQSMVLTEKDYFDFLMNIYREDEKLVLPSVIRKALATSSLLFTGYEMDSLSFRIILASLASYTSLFSMYQNVAIFRPLMSPKSERGIYEYLNQYAKTVFNVQVYWVDTSNFSAELNERWNSFRTKAQNNL